MKTSLGIAFVFVIGLFASACLDGGGDGGASEAGGSSATSGSAGTGANDPARKVVDCGIHSSIGSCSPIADHCYCSESRCQNSSPGEYFCVFSCVFDSDCVFDLKTPGKTELWEGTCIGGGDGPKYCVPKSTGPTSGSGGMGGSGQGGAGPGQGGSGNTVGSAGAGPGQGGQGGSGTSTAGFGNASGG